MSRESAIENKVGALARENVSRLPTLALVANHNEYRDL